MAETRLQLLRDYSGVVGADGTARITAIGPVIQSERWVVTSVRVESNSALIPEAYMYRSGLGTPVAATYNGSNDTNTTNTELRTGEFISIYWIGATEGAQVRVVVEGELYRRGRIAY